MTGALTWTVHNDWRWLREGGHVGLLRIILGTDRMRCGVAVTLLGFGFGLTYWKRAAREWEPHEHDGWGGEPQGMEKAP